MTGRQVSLTTAGALRKPGAAKTSRSRSFPFAARLIGIVGQYLALSFAAVLVIFPIAVAFSTSLIPAGSAGLFGLYVIPDRPSFDSYLAVSQLVPIGRFALNSILMTSGIVLGQLTTASLAGYAFTFLRFPFKNAVFFAFLATMMIPWEVTIIPNYLTILSLGWTDTFAGLIVPFTGTGFGIFFLRQAFLGVPRELREAALMDGCGELRFFGSIGLPLIRPSLATLAVYSGLRAWNEYLWPLLVTNRPDMRTIQVGITLLRDQERTDWSLVMSGVVLALIPALLLLAAGQRHIVRGLTAGALKG